MNFAKYLEKYKVEWLGILVFTCLCHSSMLLSSSVGIDTEALKAGFAENSSAGSDDAEEAYETEDSSELGGIYPEDLDDTGEGPEE